MQKTNEIIKKIENIMPLETQEIWDNSGWQIFLGNLDTKKVMVTLNVTKDVINQAIKERCDLVISHHPLIFSPVKCIDNPIIIEAVRNNIQIYSVHTNFDKFRDGTTAILAEKLGYQKLNDINEFVKCTILSKKESLKNIINKVKTTFNLKYLRISNPQKIQDIKKIAFCAGAGASFIKDLKQYNIDLFITSDIKYHDALNSENTVLVDIGHFESEITSLQMIYSLLKNDKIEIIFSNEDSIFEII